MVKTRLGDRVEILYCMDDLKVSMDGIDMACAFHQIVKGYAAAVGMVINNKKSAIQLNIQTPLPEPFEEISRRDDTTYQCLCFEMKKGDDDEKEMMEKVEQ